MVRTTFVFRTVQQRRQTLIGLTAASLLGLLFLVALFRVGRPPGLVITPLVLLVVSTISILAAGDVMQHNAVLIGQVAASGAAILAPLDSPWALVVVLVVWLFVALLRKRRDQHPSPPNWLFRAAVVTSALSGVIFFWSYREVYFALSEPPRLPSGALAQMAPIPYQTSNPVELTAHTTYHALAGAGFGLMSFVLLFFVAWNPLYAGERWGVAVLLVAGAAAVALPWLAQTQYGHAHDLWAPTILWLLSLSMAMVGLTRKQRRRSTPDAQ